MGKTLIIAEAGVNHNGDFELAKKLLLKAKESGADIVKFQTFKAENLVVKSAKKAEYQIENTKNNDSQLSMLKYLELKKEEYVKLSEYAKELNIHFLSTPFDIESLEFLKTLDMPYYKIPSGEITNLPYLQAIGKLGKKVILSTGMSKLGEVEDAIQVLKKVGTTDIILLHCTTEYPTPFEDVNLNAMKTLGQAFNLPVGYSDHTKGIEVAIAAVAMGATVIEKHFTLDKNMEGPDHKASLEPHELKSLVDSIRNIETALGDGVKRVSKSEEKNVEIVRKSIVAKTDIKKGEVFSEDNITTKRPGSGISPMKWYDVLGAKAEKNYSEDDLI